MYSSEYRFSTDINLNLGVQDPTFIFKWSLVVHIVPSYIANTTNYKIWILNFPPSPPLQDFV